MIISSGVHIRRSGRIRLGSPLLLAASLLLPEALLSPVAHAFQRVILRSGFSYDCSRYEAVDSDHMRLFLIPRPGDFIDIARGQIVRIENLPDPPQPDPAPSKSAQAYTARAATVSVPAAANIPQLLSAAGRQHRIDAALLASIVKAESNGRPDAVSRAGAQGLMQLMPGTAQQLGVSNAFRPDENITGGAAYLDELLNRYDPHNDSHGLALALAAYNAGPGAVDRYHGIPPYPETIRYVNRVMAEFNRRKLEVQRQQALAHRKSSSTGQDQPAAGGADAARRDAEADDNVGEGSAENSGNMAITIASIGSR